MRDSPYYAQAELLVRYLPALAAAECFALKGGTAINLFVRDLPRLSVDIDLAYTPLTGRERALEHIRAAMAEMAARATGLIPGLRVIATGAAEAPKQIAVAAGAQIKVEPNPCYGARFSSRKNGGSRRPPKRCSGGRQRSESCPCRICTQASCAQRSTAVIPATGST